MELFDRTVAITIDTVHLTGLHAEFTIKKNTANAPNTLDLKVYNLSEASRGSILKKGARIIVEAGYRDGIQQLFLGDARSVMHSHDGTTWTTNIQAGDGERAIANANSSWAFEAGAKPIDVIERLAKDMDIKSLDAIQQVRRGDFKQYLPDEFSSGMSFDAPTRKILSRVLAPLKWSIQDGILRIHVTDQPDKETFVLLSPDTGLIGTPDIGTDGKLKIKSLLEGRIRPGRKVVVESRGFQGDAIVISMIHRGDTHGKNWYTEMEAKPCAPSKK